MSDLAARPVGLFGLDPVAVVAVDRAEANRLLVSWRHQLGPCDRPFGQDHWLLAIDGEPVSLTITASTVSPSVTDEHGRTWPRRQLVELARIASHPAHPWATRPMLRLWREVLARRWSHWPPAAAVSYSMPGKAGHIYRHDGWTFVRWCKPANPGAGSTWARASRTDSIDNGRKGLWIWHFGPNPEGEA